MDAILTYIKPELLILIVVLWFVGLALKKWDNVKDKYIPLILGGSGVLLAVIWVLATTAIPDWQGALMAIFVALTQGILCAGASVYADQLIFKQPKREE
jgi:hypothetical protein